MNERPTLRPRLLVLLILAILLGTTFADDPPESGPKRIISMAPGTTEVLFALGLGHRVVGVTRYCDYPTSVTTKTDVGGFYDPNYEQIIALKSDMVVLLPPHDEMRKELDKLKVPYTTVPNNTVEDIYTSILTIGRKCGITERAEKFVADLKTRVAKVKSAVEGKATPSILICIQRDMTSGNMSGLYTAGVGTFYDEIITKAGGVNAVKTKGYPKLSAEGIIALDPDVIIDLAGDLKKIDKTPEEIVKQWDFFKTVKAIRNDEVHLIVGYHALRPSPRFVIFLEQLAKTLHPDAFKDVEAQ